MIEGAINVLHQLTQLRTLLYTSILIKLPWVLLEWPKD